jgi:cytochrome c peroxidase
MNNSSTSTAPDMYVAIADARASSNPVIVVQRRGPSPALLVIPVTASGPSLGSMGPAVPLPQRTLHVDTGFDVFHMPTAGGIACMNCHAEGGDDGHTWQFQLAGNEIRERRTQSLHGGIIAGSAPYHWDGDMPDMQFLCDEVFTHRMGGGQVTIDQGHILNHYLTALPRVPVKATLDPTSVAAGQAIFQGSGGCMGCHTGAGGSRQLQAIGKQDMFSTIQNKPLQVPILTDVADRAPYMHDGCATSLMDRLDNPNCAGTSHGNVTGLSTDDKQNLVAYLQSL